MHHCSSLATAPPLPDRHATSGERTSRQDTGIGSKRRMLHQVPDILRI